MAMSENKGEGRARMIYGILQRQGFKCALSGVDLDPDSASLDHIIPVSKGGSYDSADNLQIVTMEINRMKGALMNDEFVDLCRTVYKNAKP
jgi:5-methylcytosine-specific restriction endonuclease McrA